MRSIDLAGQQTLGTVLDASVMSADAGCADGESAHQQSNAPPVCHTGVWVQTTGSNLSFSGSNGLNASGFGLLGGGDHAFDVAHVGIEAGFDRTNANDPLGGFGNAQTAHAGLYSFAPLGPLWLSATADAAYNDYRINRVTGIGNAVASPDGHTISAGLQAAWPLQFAEWQLTPKLGALYQHQSVDGFNESLSSDNPLASAFAIRSAHTTYTSLQPYGAVAVTRSFVYQGITYLPELNVGYRYDTRGPTPPTVQALTQDGSMFPLPGAALGRGLGTAGARITAEAGASWSLYLGYQGLFASHLQDNEFTLGLVKHF
jgi:outer membrane autotransporter protein